MTQTTTYFTLIILSEYSILLDSSAMQYRQQIYFVPLTSMQRGFVVKNQYEVSVIATKRWLKSTTWSYKSANVSRNESLNTELILLYFLLQPDTRK